MKNKWFGLIIIQTIIIISLTIFSVLNKLPQKFMHSLTVAEAKKETTEYVINLGEYKNIQIIQPDSQGVNIISKYEIAILFLVYKNGISTEFWVLDSGHKMKILNFGSYYE